MHFVQTRGKRKGRTAVNSTNDMPRHPFAINKGAPLAFAALALRSYYPSSLHASATACITPLRELPSYRQSDKP